MYIRVYMCYTHVYYGVKGVYILKEFKGACAIMVADDVSSVSDNPLTTTYTEKKNALEFILVPTLV